MGVPKSATRCMSSSHAPFASHAFPGSVTGCSWRTVAGVLPVDQGSLWPLPLALPQHSCSVQDLLLTWQSKGYGLTRKPHLVSLQLQRFTVQEGSLVRNKALISLDPVVSFNLIEGSVLRMFLRRCRQLTQLETEAWRHMERKTSSCLTGASPDGGAGGSTS